MQPELTKQLTASGFVLHPDRKILLVHHRKLGVWLYPGGHVERNETPDQAVIREVHEETGVRARILGERDMSLADPKAEVHVLHTPHRVLCELINDPKDPHYHIDMIYLCAAVSLDCTVNAEVKDARFFSWAEARELDCFPSFRVLLQQVFEDDRLWTDLLRVEALA